MPQQIVQIEKNPSDVARVAAAYIAFSLSATVAAHGRCALGISGGNTPRGTFEVLAAAPYLTSIPWKNLDIFWVDERVVAPGDPRSNAAAARNWLLDRVPLEPARVHPIPVMQDDVVKRYTRWLNKARGLDVVLLGVGNDGHVASIFPHTPEPPPGTSVVESVDTAAVRRVSLTLDALAAARKHIVIATGSDKAAAVADGVALRGASPIARLGRKATLDWFVDFDAGAEISATPGHTYSSFSIQ